MPTTFTTSISAPSNLFVDATGADTASLSWTDNSDNEDGYSIERADSGGSFSEIATVGSNVTTYDDSGLASGQYTYRVRAYIGTDYSDYSNEAAAVFAAASASTVQSSTGGSTYTSSADSISPTAFTANTESANVDTVVVYTERVMEAVTTGYFNGNNANITNAANSKHITFSTTYQRPVVVGNINTGEGGQNVDNRAANVTSSGCDYYSHEPDNQGHSDNDHSLFVAEEGVWYTSDGAKIEAGRHVTEKKISPGETFSGDYVEFDHNWSQAPVVVAMVNTQNDTTFSTPAVNNITTDGFEVAQQPEGSSYTSEAIGWIAFERGVSHIDGYDVDVFTTTNTSKTYDASYSDAPAIVVDDQVRGSGGKWVRTTNWGSNSTDWYLESGGGGTTFGGVVFPRNITIEGLPATGDLRGTLEYIGTDYLRYQWYDTYEIYNEKGHPQNASEFDLYFQENRNDVALGGTGNHEKRVYWGSAGDDANPSYLPGSTFSWRVDGYFYAPESGTYTFAVDGDDAVDVRIDGSIIASWYGGHGSEDGWSHDGTVSLDSGFHRVVFRQEEGGGGEGAALGWQKPSDSSVSPIPSSYFYAGIQDSKGYAAEWADNKFGNWGNFRGDIDTQGTKEGFHDVVGYADATSNSGYEDIFTGQFTTGDVANSGSGKNVYLAFAAKWNEIPTWVYGKTWVKKPTPDPNEYQLYILKSDGQNSPDEYFRLYYKDTNDTAKGYIADPYVWKGDGFDADAPTDAKIAGSDSDRTVVPVGGNGTYLGGTYSGTKQSNTSIGEYSSSQSVTSTSFTSAAASSITSTALRGQSATTGLQSLVGATSGVTVNTTGVSSTQLSFSQTSTSVTTALDGVLASTNQGSGSASATASGSTTGASSFTKGASGSLVYDGPGNVTASYNNDRSITVSWTKTNAEADQFHVRMKRDDETWADPATGAYTDASNTSLTVGDESDNPYNEVVGVDSRFRFVVRTEGAGTSSSWNGSGSVYTTPIPPHNPSVSRPDANTISASATMKTDTPDRWRVDYRLDAGSGYGSWSFFDMIHAGEETSGNVDQTGSTVTKDYKVGSSYQSGHTVQSDARYQFRFRTRGPDDKYSDIVYADYGNRNNVYFEDGFESGDISAWDSSNGGHSVGGGSHGDTGIADSNEGSYYLKGYGADSTESTWVQKDLGDLSGETNVFFKCAFAWGSLDSGGEDFGVKWYDGSSWQDLRNESAEYNEQGWVEFQATVPDSWLSTDNRVRVGTTNGSGMYRGDHFAVDRVVVSDILHEYTKPATPTDVAVVDKHLPYEVEGSITPTLTVGWTDTTAFNSVYDKEWRKSSSSSWDNTEWGGGKPYEIPRSSNPDLAEDTYYDIRVGGFYRQHRHGNRASMFWSDWSGTVSARTLADETATASRPGSTASSRGASVASTSTGGGVEASSTSIRIGSVLSNSNSGAVESAAANISQASVFSAVDKFAPQQSASVSEFAALGTSVVNSPQPKAQASATPQAGDFGLVRSFASRVTAQATSSSVVGSVVSSSPGGIETGQTQTNSAVVDTNSLSAGLETADVNTFDLVPFVSSSSGSVTPGDSTTQPSVGYSRTDASGITTSAGSTGSAVISTKANASLSTRVSTATSSIASVQANASDLAAQTASAATEVKGVSTTLATAEVKLDGGKIASALASGKRSNETTRTQAQASVETATASINPVDGFVIQLVEGATATAATSIATQQPIARVLTTNLVSIGGEGSAATGLGQGTAGTVTPFDTDQNIPDVFANTTSVGETETASETEIKAAATAQSSSSSVTPSQASVFPASIFTQTDAGGIEQVETDATLAGVFTRSDSSATRKTAVGGGLETNPIASSRDGSITQLASKTALSNGFTKADSDSTPLPVNAFPRAVNPVARTLSSSTPASTLFNVREVNAYVRVIVGSVTNGALSVESAQVDTSVNVVGLDVDGRGKANVDIQALTIAVAYAADERAIVYTYSAGAYTSTAATGRKQQSYSVGRGLVDPQTSSTAASASASSDVAMMESEAFTATGGVGKTSFSAGDGSIAYLMPVQDPVDISVSEEQVESVVANYGVEISEVETDVSVESSEASADVKRTETSSDVESTSTSVTLND